MQCILLCLWQIRFLWNGWFFAQWVTNFYLEIKAHILYPPPSWLYWWVILKLESVFRILRIQYRLLQNFLILVGFSRYWLTSQPTRRLTDKHNSTTTMAKEKIPGFMCEFFYRWKGVSPPIDILTLGSISMVLPCVLFLFTDQGVNSWYGSDYCIYNENVTGEAMLCEIAS